MGEAKSEHEEDEILFSRASHTLSRSDRRSSARGCHRGEVGADPGCDRRRDDGAKMFFGICKDHCCLPRGRRLSEVFDLENLHSRNEKRVEFLRGRVRQNEDKQMQKIGFKNVIAMSKTHTAMTQPNTHRGEIWTKSFY